MTDKPNGRASLRAIAWRIIWLPVFLVFLVLVIIRNVLRKERFQS